MPPVMTFISPGGISKELENEFAKIILESCLLVVEDEEFFLRFILADSTSFPHRSDSVLLDSLLFSSSLAAGAIFMKKVSLGAAALPLIFTTVFGLRTGTQLIERRQAYKLKSTLCCLISSMKQVKTMLSKSLNLIRGMEMISKGCLVAVKSGQLESGSSTLEESKLSKAQYNRTLLIPLRQSVYSESLRMILALRGGIESLMSIAPLPDHIDHKDQYLAFVDLQHFGLSSEPSDDSLTIPQLRDTIQLYLLQQSEYLRRLCLSACVKAGGHHSLDSYAVQKHIEDITESMEAARNRLSQVVEYQQAMGVVTEVPVSQLLPLPSVYTTLHTTGLHLQNCLLKVRQLEDCCDAVREDKDDTDFLTTSKLSEWLQGLLEIQDELKTCQEYIEDGAEDISRTLKPVDSTVQKLETTVASSPRHGRDIQNKVITENYNIYHVDEVFEAYITNATVDLANTDADTINLENKRTGQEKKESRAVLQELKSVLVSKQKEWKVREAKALARQQGTDYSEPEPVPVMASGLLSARPGVETDSGQLYNQADIAWAAQDRGHQHYLAGVFFSDTSGSDSGSGLELLGLEQAVQKTIETSSYQVPGWQRYRWQQGEDCV
eukprot:TRINITY_DN15665_c0_g1_i5.p1 TRINITY_DN15665_c0_g1~~TRINITY_DN15665_c0_g1_i5.p1  ORF type:complete len:614 (+),score=153.85 TRINITY_DN15665_c0_g1_i5:23-1843(+)